MINFNPTDEQRQIIDMVSRFAADVVRPNARDCEENKEIPEDLLSKFWELGLVVNSIPEACGGYGFERSALTGVLIAEELAYGDLALAVAMLSPTLFVYPLLDMGTEEQQMKYLPAFCGESFKYGSMALMEPRVLFDPNDIKTTAVREGDEYVINGEKCMVPFASKAEHVLVLASSAFGSGTGGVQAYIVPQGASGMQVAEREKYMGLNALELNKVTFSDCRIPVENRLGGVKGGNYQRLLNLSRASWTAMAAGVCRAIWNYGVGYAKERVQFGEPIANRQAIAFILADMAIEADAMRFLSWKAAWAADRGDDFTKEAYLAKLYASEYAANIGNNGVQVLGGHGYIREHPMELWFRNARGFEIIDGLAMV